MYDINTHVVYAYKFIYKRNMGIYIYILHTYVFPLKVCVSSRLPAAHKKPQCVYLSAEYGPL